MKRRVNIALTLLAALAMVMTMSAAAFADAITSNDAALKKALKNAGLRKTEVTRIDVEYDREDDVYEVEFKQKSDGRKYDYEIAAASGKIIKKSVDYKYKRNSSHRKIGKTAARKKVAKFSGISYKIICTGTCSYEYDDRQGTYEVKFTKGSRRYEYDVLAPTGKIIEYEWKVINK
ncbi:MAG: PepSY domain-containing protein [Eubacterium sp.]|nr:PepSY domain-containing protein [Eubacterium sp.]